MPPELTSVLVQFPVVSLVGFVAWYAYRELKATGADYVKQERQAHATAVADLKAAHEREVAALKAEAAELKGLLRGDIKKLTKAVDELNGRLGG